MRWRKRITSGRRRSASALKSDQLRLKREAVPEWGTAGVQPSDGLNSVMAEGYGSGIFAQVLLVHDAVLSDANVMIPEFLYSAG